MEEDGHRAQIGVSAEELELMEKRVAEIEKYLGIDGFEGSSAIGRMDTLDKKA